MNRSGAALWLAALVLAAGAGPLSRSLAQGALPQNPPVASPSPAPSLPSVPPDSPPPGVREPLVGAVAVVSLVVAAAAGLWIYRVIRRGL
ncbi:MAG: hypothetical protein ACRDIF_02450 [Actinomycetota bacterium]